MSKHDELMNAAYDRWRENNWSREEFLDQLTPQEKFAVCTGNLNYQVENGGFSQWCENGYGTEETVTYLLRALARMDYNESVDTVFGLLEKYSSLNKPGGFDLEEDFEWDEWEQDIDLLCNEYYKVNSDFLACCDIHLEKGGW